MISSRKIETLAIHELNGALLKCPYLSSFIDSNDRTPAWDGCVMVYDRPNEEKKKNMRGRVPVQVKGVQPFRLRLQIWNDITTMAELFFSLFKLMWKKMKAQFFI